MLALEMQHQGVLTMQPQKNSLQQVGMKDRVYPSTRPFPELQDTDSFRMTGPKLIQTELGGRHGDHY
jgi:hypothetical protein